MRATMLNCITMLLGWGGVFVAGVLTLAHTLGLKAPCGESLDCDRVARDPSSVIMGIPVAAFGLMAYLALVAFAGIRMVASPALFRRLTIIGLVISGVGVLVSIYLTYYSLTEIRATCKWCLASGGIMLLTFLTHGFLANATEEPVQKISFDRTMFLAIAVLALGGIGMQAVAMKPVPPIVRKWDGRTVTPDDLVPNNKYYKGPLSAPITVVEFADFLCPACRTTYPEVRDFIARCNGKVKIAFRNYPLYDKEEHAMSIPAAMISEIASDEGKFWDFIDAGLQAPSDNVQTLDGWIAIASQVGMDGQKVRERLTKDQKGLLDRVYDDRQNGHKVGVNRTPTYLIFAEGVPEPTAATSDDVIQILSKPPYIGIIQGSDGSKN